MTAPANIWIDTDMGVDDLFAILLTQKHTRIDGISLCFGNAPLPQVTGNAAAAMAVFGWNTPLFAGAHRAVLGQIDTAQSVLGDSGMPTRGLSFPPVTATFPPAIPAMARWLSGQRDAQILALGPLTNLATLALTYPDLLANIGRITWMGGAVGQGNHTPAAEFNAFADPEALAILLSRDVPLTMVDLDICRQITITEQDLAQIANPLLRDFAGGYLDIGLKRGRNAMALYDPVAAAALVRPDLFTAYTADITVELAGQHTRGRTTVDLRAPKHRHLMVLCACDVEQVHALCLAGIAP